MGKPKAIRNEILAVPLPMLVVQGTRDSLGSAAEMEAVLKPLGRARVKASKVETIRSSVAQSEPGRGGERERVYDDVATAVAEFVRSPVRRAKKTRRSRDLGDRRRDRARDRRIVRDRDGDRSQIAPRAQRRSSSSHGGLRASMR